MGSLCTRLVVRRVLFAVEVFSVEDSCNKSISSLHADMPLADLVKSIGHEFGLDARQRMKLMFGDQDLSESSPCTSLGKAGLGLRAWSQVAFTVLNKPFALDVVNLLGERVCHINVYDDTRLGDILSEVNEVFPESLERGWALQLVSGFEALGAERGYQTLCDLGIHSGSPPLLCLKVKLDLDCPKCASSRHSMRGVMTAATHEGWGLKWNACYYDCFCCQEAILPGLYVNACGACKGFWHKNCL